MSEYRKNRLLWIDWLKVIAVFGVALIHISNHYIQDNLFLTYNWFIGLGFESISRCAVPLFIMVSGFLVLRREESISDTPKRLKRILLPFAFWMLISVINQLGFSNLFEVIKYYLSGFFNPTGVNLLYWFVYMILGLYLFAPILSKWISNSTIKEVEYFLGIWLFVMIVSLTILLTGYSSVIPKYFTYFGGAIGYFVLGYYLVFKDSKYLKSRKIGLLLFIAGFLMTYLGTAILSYVKGIPIFILILHGDNTPNACLMAVGLFIMVKNTSFNKITGKVNDMVVLISKGSYGFYLAHYFLINIFMANVHLFSQDTASLMNNNSLITIPLLAIFVVISTNVLIYLMSKIPVLKSFSGFPVKK